MFQTYAHRKIIHEARAMGYSRDTFCRVKRAYEDGGLEALNEKSRQAPNIRKRVSEDVEEAVVELAIEDPAYAA